jgi:hypothetical protein
METLKERVVKPKSHKRLRLRFESVVIFFVGFGALGWFRLVKFSLINKAMSNPARAAGRQKSVKLDPFSKSSNTVVNGILSYLQI